MPKKPELLAPEDNGFQTYLSDHGFHLPGHGDYSEPANLDELKAVMVRNDRQDIDDAALKISEVPHRDRIMLRAVPILNGAGDTGFEAGITFDNLKPLIERSDSRKPGLIEARPALYRGANKGKLNSSVIKALGPLIVPSRLSDALVVPNFFVEAWADNSKADERKRQSLYIGCMGARGIQALQSHGTTPIYDDNAYSIMADIYDSILTLHSVHLTKPGECESSPSFHMTCLAVLPMVSKDQFRAAVVAYRNLRDWADQKRDYFINSANERVMLPLSLAKHLGILGLMWLIDAPGNRKFAVLNGSTQRRLNGLS